MKLSAGVFCFQAQQTLCCHWPSVAVHHQCPHRGNGQPEEHRESDRTGYYSGKNRHKTLKTHTFKMFYRLCLIAKLSKVYYSGVCKLWQTYRSFVQMSILTLCSCAASIKMVPTPHIGSTTQKPGWVTGDNIQQGQYYIIFWPVCMQMLWHTDCQVTDNKHYAKRLKTRTALRLSGHI